MVYDIRFVGFDLPEDTPPYKFDPNQPYGYAETHLTKEIRKLYIFLNDYVTIDKKRKETLFIQLLENLHFREAELLLAVKDKDISSIFHGINECLIREVFPDLLSPLYETNYIDCAIINGFGKYENIDNLVYSRYTIDEVKRAAKSNTIVFFDYEHAKLAGIETLSYDYVPEIDKEKNIEVILTKTVFGNERVIRTWVPIDNIAMSKKASELRFVDIERAKALGIDHYEQNKFQQKLAREEESRAIREAKKAAQLTGEKVEVKKPKTSTKVSANDIIRPPRKPKANVNETPK